MIKEPWIYNGEMTASSTAGVSKTGLLSQPVHKSKLKMDQRPE